MRGKRTGRTTALVALAMLTAAAWLGACSSFSGEEATPGAEGGLPESGPPTRDGAAPASRCDPATTASDPLHCGRCDHSCQGGRCQSGVCQPVLLGVSVGELVHDVGVDAQRVLWRTTRASRGHVYGCPKPGCAAAAPSTFSETNTLPGSLAANGKEAFFSTSYAGRKLTRVRPDGTTSNAGAAHQTALRLHFYEGALVFSTLYGGEPPVEAGTFGANVIRLGVEEGAAEMPIGSFVSASNYQEALAAGGRIFFASPTGLAVCSIGSCSGEPTRLVGGFPNVLSLASDRQRIYWAEGAFGGVRACDVAAAAPCSPQLTLDASALGGNEVLQIAFLQGRLYMSTATEIWACEPASCAPTLKRVVHETRLFEAGEYLYGHHVAVDETAIYWAAVEGQGPAGDGGVEDTTGLTHRIMKLAK